MSLFRDAKETKAGCMICKGARLVGIVMTLGLSIKFKIGPCPWCKGSGEIKIRY